VVSIIYSAMSDTSERLTFSPQEVCKLLGLSRGSVYEAIRTGQIPSVKIGRRILVPRVALERLLEDRRADTAPASEGFQGT
jgi:excisionase family DNA binding protein